MRTLNVTISDREYKLYGIKKDNISFADVVDLIKREMAIENLDKCVELSQKYGLSQITLDEINDEINAVRKDAKTNH